MLMLFTQLAIDVTGVKKLVGKHGPNEKGGMGTISKLVFRVISKNFDYIIS